MNGHDMGHAAPLNSAPEDNFPMQEVKSSNISHIGWHGGVLRILFLNGKTYSYANVPETLFEYMSKAPSIGKFFFKHIKGKYECTKEGLYE